MNANEISNAAATLGRKGGLAKTESKTSAARSNGAKGGRPFTWFPEPRRGCKNTLMELYKFTVIRLSDRKERFTDRRPRPEIFRDLDMMVWNNRENREER